VKPIDPATRLSDLLAQSLEELTRPFDGPAPAKVSPAALAATDKPQGPAPAKPLDAPPVSRPSAQPAETPPANTAMSGRGSDQPEPRPGLSLDLEAERALAELEAELFAATKKASEAGRPAEDVKPDDGRPATADQAIADQPDVTPAPELAAQTPAEVEAPPPPADAAAAQLIARVRRLMLATILVTLLAVGGLFAFIGYRIYKSEEAIDKKVDKIPLQVPAQPPEVTLSLPPNARIIQAGVAEERLVITLEIDGKIEVRVYDVKTLEPAARMGFSTTP
jgi:hypothetical protein